MLRKIFSLHSYVENILVMMYMYLVMYYLNIDMMYMYLVMYYLNIDFKSQVFSNDRKLIN